MNGLIELAKGQRFMRRLASGQAAAPADFTRISRICRRHHSDVVGLLISRRPVAARLSGVEAWVGVTETINVQSHAYRRPPPGRNTGGRDQRPAHRGI
jgi:hypothetical protein